MGRAADEVRRPVTPALAKICNSLEIRVIPTTKRRSPGETCAEQTMERILAEHGAGHLVFVLRTIVETDNNKMELVAPVIYAISDIVADYREWADQVTPWFESFDKMGIPALRSALKRRKRGRQRQRLYDAFLDRLEPVFRPIKQERLF